MLMALLPLAGWAQTATLGQVAVGEFTYGDGALPVPVVKDSEGAILDDGTHYTVSGTAYKEEACTTPVNMEDMKGGTTYWLKITGAGAYLGQSKAVYFTAKKKTLTITVNTAFNRAYLGTVEPVIDPATDLAYGGLATAAPYNDDAANIAGTTDITGTLAYTYAGYGDPSYNGGVYAITFSGLNSDQYDIKYTEKNFTITGTPVVIGDVAVKAGTAFADQTYKGTAFVAADLTGLVLTYNGAELVQGTDFDIVLDNGGDDYTTVGNQHYSVNFKGNYSGNANDFATFAIVAAPLSVDIASFNIKYDAAEHNNNAALGKTTAADFKWYGFVAADVAGKDALIATYGVPTIAIDNADGKAKNQGEYKLKLSGGAAGGNYVLANYLNTGKLTIDPFEVTVTADNKTKGPGDDDPAWTYTATALPGTDAIVAGSITFTRPEGNVVGQSYELTPDFSKVQVKNGTTDVTSNYTWKAGTPKGKLTVDKASLTITILDQNKYYGDEDPASITTPVKDVNYIVTGLVEGDEITSLTLTKSWTDASDAGNYILNGTAVYTGTDHYTGITIVPGIFEIKKAPLAVTLPIKTVTAGDTPANTLPQLKKDGITIDGFKKGETVADTYDLSFKAGLTTDGGGNLVDQTDNAGYVLTLKAAYQTNYEIIGTNMILAGTAAAGKLIVGTGAPAGLAFTSIDADYATIVAHDGETQNVTLDLTPRNGRTVPASKAHSWAAKTWNTMVLPFEVSVADLSQALGYAIVNRVDASATTEGNVQFKLEMDKIPANEPFCVKTTEAKTGVITFPNPVKIVAPANEYPDVDAGMGYKFVGVYKTTTINNETPIYNFLRGDNDKWAHIGASSANSWSAVPFDAYVELTPAGAARGVTFTFQELDGSYTAIKSVEASVNDNIKTGWYNLNGVKMEGAPTQKGIYINNGKKVVIK